MAKWYAKNYKLISLMALFMFIASVSYYQQAILSYILCPINELFSYSTEFAAPIEQNEWLKQTSKLLVNKLIN